MELTVLSEDQISALPLTDKEKKSNEAFAKLAAIIKHYNDGWKHTCGKGYFIYYKKKLYRDGNVYFYFNFTHYDQRWGKESPHLCSRLYIKDYETARFIMRNYKHLYKDLWKEE